MKEISKVTFVIIGTMIGAGFASGQEIQVFFNRYGLNGIIGLAFSFALTGIIIYKVFKLVKKYNICNYEDFLKLQSKNEKVSKIIKVIVELFLLISYYVMIAGFCAYFYEAWNVPIIFSAVCVGFLCYIIFHKNLNGVISINMVLMPLLICFIFFLGIKNIPFTIKYIESGNLQIITSKIPFSWLFSSILYASYNSIILIPMLIELTNYVKNNSSLKKITFISSFFLLGLGLFIFSLLLRGENYIKEIELPMLQIAKEFGKSYTLLYGGVIISAIFTSAISAGHEFLKGLPNLEKTPKKYDKVVILLCISAIFTAHIGFAKLVNILYPIFGVLGLFQIVGLLKIKIK